jgi:hypothetical protein
MNIRSKARPALVKSKIVISLLVLMLVLSVNVFPVGAAPGPVDPQSGLVLQTTATLTFTASADAHVEQRSPTANRGTYSHLVADGSSSREIESYIRFAVSRVTGTIQNARLRVYSTTDPTRNGPAVYAADNNWTETGITWNNRPARTSGAVDNKGSINRSTWVEYNVTILLSGDGTYTFVLAGDSSDDIRFSSRQGSQPPQLVITFSAGTNTPTVTPTGTSTLPPSATLTQTPLPAFTATATSQPQATATYTPSSTPTALPTDTPSPTLTLPPPSPPTTATTLPVTMYTFTTVADARVEQSTPATNYGKSTTLQVDGDPGIAETSYIRFSVSGLNGYIQNVKLRVFCTTNATVNGPAVHLADNSWIESGTGGMTWNAQPALLSGPLESKEAIGLSSWVEYDVTAVITGDGTYTFALVADGNDGVTFSSREGATPPQLVITTGPGAPTASPTAVPTLSPTPRSTESVVLVGAGDIATCSGNQDELTAQLLDAIPGTVFTAGDNAYIDGTYSEYINCYDPTWGRHKSRTNPSPGNHEYNTAGAAGYYQYFENISSYYAYDLGAWRIYALNSEIDVSASSPQVAWLQTDLAANPSQCVLAYWHKPRWSSGATHGDNSAMQTIWQIFYDAGAELVINGHEHNYERFAEMDGTGAAVSGGLREFVVGTGGAGLYPLGTPLPASEVRDDSTFGVLKLTLHATAYDWEFIPIPGSSFADSGSGSCR